jgi:hypothetical protein
MSHKANDQLSDEFYDNQLDIIEDYVREEMPEAEIIDFLFANKELLKYFLEHVADDVAKNYKVYEWFTRNKKEATE